MSDSTGHTPSRKNGPSRDDDADGNSEPSPETAARGSADRSNPPATGLWATQWRERIFAWLDETLSRNSGQADPFYLSTALPVMDRLAGIGTGLMAMVMVDRHHGSAGLGIFAWFFSLLAIAGYLGRYGIPIYLENRIARSPESIDESCAGALAALVALGLAATLLCGAAAFWIAGPEDGAGERILYLLLGPTVLIQNINALRLAMLNGTGRHRAAAGLRIRQRVVFLAVTLGLCMADVPVHLVAAAFLLSQVVMVGMGRKAVKLPAISSGFARRKQIPAMMDNGRAFLFTDNLLDVVFYLDMLILGWFASPVELGIYARALILARLFLVIPGGFRPVFRRLANERLTVGLDDRLLAFMAGAVRSLFFIHGCLAVLVLVNFPRVMAMVFDIQKWADESFIVFTLVLPGLIFFSAVTALEPIFEARQQTDKLKQMTLAVSIANLILNLNLIPFAGLAGAAMATAAAMFIHFLLFCRLLPPDFGSVRIFWPGAAAALYLTYVLLAYFDIGMLYTLMLTPVLFGGLLHLAGFFNSFYPQRRIDSRQQTPA
ncbi:lipopolysaccharide biosynthesis protein [Desulfosarcina sp.]|uniref:lipopolysaccharide biosynthesis protein n=1 Tax=Desulfosarcina sp. TaxID=2027861 RepID=UPI0035616BCD